MGTGRSGLYANTYGAVPSKALQQPKTQSSSASITISDSALKHASEGEFVDSLVKINGKKVRIKRMKSGGHGQENIEKLEECGIEYEITKTYTNGVRVGNVENHPDLSKSKRSGQSWFPVSWTTNTIKESGEYVAKLHNNMKDGQIYYGIFKDVKVCIINTNGKIATIFPDSDQSSISEEVKL